MNLLARTLLAALAVQLTATASYAADTVRVRYSWKMKGEYGAFYVAKEQGLFQKQGLDVSLGEGAGASAALAGLLQGNEDVVVLPAAFALTAITKGMPIKIVALYHPKTPLGIASFPDKPLTKPADLEGKSIVTSPGDTVAAYLNTFCKLTKIDCDKIKRVSIGIEARNAQFLARNVDVTGTYMNVDLPILEREAKQTLPTLHLADYGLVLPGLSVVTSDAKLKSEPQKLAKFLKAVGDATEMMKKNPLAAADDMLKTWTVSPPKEIVVKQITETAAVIPQIPDKPYGWIVEEQLKQALDVLKEGQEITEAKPLETYYSNALLQ